MRGREKLRQAGGKNSGKRAEKLGQAMNIGSLWQEQLSSTIEELYAEIGRIRKEQELDDETRLKRISPAIKEYIIRLLHVASLSRQFFNLKIFNQPFGEEAESPSENDALTGDVEHPKKIAIVAYINATFTKKRAAKFLQNFEEPSANNSISLQLRPWSNSRAWPQINAALSGVAQIYVLDRESHSAQASFSTKICALSPFEAVLTYLSKFLKDSGKVELYFSVGDSLCHLDCKAPEGALAMLTREISSVWKFEEPAHRQIQVTCIVEKVKLRPILTGTFSVASNPIFCLNFPAESGVVDLRDCRQLIEDAVRKSPAPENSRAHKFTTAISLGQWYYMKRGLAIPLLDELGYPALELAIETGSTCMMKHSMDESLIFAIEYVH